MRSPSLPAQQRKARSKQRRVIFEYKVTPQPPSIRPKRTDHLWSAVALPPLSRIQHNHPKLTLSELTPKRVIPNSRFLRVRDLLFSRKPQHPKNKKGHPKGGLLRKKLLNLNLFLRRQFVLNQRLNHRLQNLLRHPLQHIRTHLRNHPRHKGIHIRLLCLRRRCGLVNRVCGWCRLLNSLFHSLRHLRRLFRRSRRLHLRNIARLRFLMHLLLQRLIQFRRRARSISRFRSGFRLGEIQRWKFIRTFRTLRLRTLPRCRRRCFRHLSRLLLAEFRRLMERCLFHKLIHHRARRFRHRRWRLFLEELLCLRNTRRHRRRWRVPGSCEQRRFLRFQFPRRIRHAGPVRGPSGLHSLRRRLNHSRIHVYRSRNLRSLFANAGNLFLRSRR